ncbi:MAG: hypothetical protein EPN33_05100 [Acidobacteria bacterium]|nr:MAG: hypothetical protein EPN33_05100 [Acidobacteriota bacterium]
MVLDPPSREAYVRRAARLYIIFPQTWNAYAYVGNQPLANVDPLGLRQCATHNGRCMPTLYGGAAPQPTTACLAPTPIGTCLR